MRAKPPRDQLTTHMTAPNLNWIANYIWGIADDVLRSICVRGKYRDVILPMTVLRRLDAMLEPTRQAVLDMKEALDAAGVTNQDAPGATLYTDDATAYKGSGREHETVKHSAAEYVRYLENEKVHTNGVESFWSMLKRAHKDIYHRLSAKHLQRYVSEFAGRQNIRELDTLA